MGPLECLRIWDDPALRDALAWYLDVAENRRPAKFRIAVTVPTSFDPAIATEEALWAELEQLTQSFLARWEAIRAGAPLPQPANGPSLLELCRELAYRMLAPCNFCPWNCRVDRRTGITVSLGLASSPRAQG
jgi:putative pyruvate formate lyase activating enzyme